MAKRWYVVHAYSGYEKKVAKELECLKSPKRRELGLGKIKGYTI